LIYAHNDYLQLFAEMGLLGAFIFLESNASYCHVQFGYPRVSSLRLREWVARWVERDGFYRNLPTQFHQRSEFPCCFLAYDLAVSQDSGYF